jgi:hypothetical protein
VRLTGALVSLGKGNVSLLEVFDEAEGRTKEPFPSGAGFRDKSLLAGLEAGRLAGLKAANNPAGGKAIHDYTYRF